MRWVSGLLLSLASPITSETCTCGYAMTDDAHQKAPLVFTDALVTDFASLGDISLDTDWTRQQFNVSTRDGRGEFGKTFKVENVFSYAGPHAFDGEDLNRNIRGQSAMGLRVGSIPTKVGAITAAEIDSARMDMFWGSYRVVMKLTAVSGTCAAFFWYRNDSQEIDMEFLSREFNIAGKAFPVNLVLHSRESMRDGYDASKSGTLRRVELSFDPTSSFHEYRFDYLPGRVTFYADGQFLAEMKGEHVPSSAGHLILQHWSNGNRLWSGGPPSSDAVVLVRTVKAYFNSSGARKDRKWNEMCSNGEGKAKMCQVSNGTLEDGRWSDNSTRDSGDANDDEPSTQEDSLGSHKTTPKPPWLAFLVAACVLLSGM